MTVYSGQTEKARRPKDRKQRILAVAARRFRSVGYHNVRMAEIAASVGITAGALYRHFRGKQDLLFGCVDEPVRRFGALVRESATLDELVRAGAEFAMEQRELGVLWQREVRHLPEREQGALRQRMRECGREFAARIGDSRPELSEVDADLLAWCAMTVLASPAHHSVELDRARFEAVLRGAVTAVVTVPLPDGEPGREPVNGNGIGRTSRREALLAAAIRLFDEQGYRAVRMTEVGAAAGISGPSVYHHFANKAELLVATLRRANETLQLGLSHALSHAQTADAALEAVLGSYLELTLEHRHLIGTLVTEMTNLPAEHRHELRRLQHEYVAEWVGLLTSVRPELTEPEARVLTHAALTVVNDISRVPHLRRRPALRAELRMICRAVLGVKGVAR